jgi:hypothetical protein
MKPRRCRSVYSRFPLLASTHPPPCSLSESFSKSVTKHLTFRSFHAGYEHLTVSGSCLVTCPATETDTCSPTGL